MPLKIKFSPIEITLSDEWVGEQEYQRIVEEYGSEYASDYMKQIVKNDFCKFINDVNLIDHIEFYWRTK
jgi:hypothetical protein